MDTRIALRIRPITSAVGALIEGVDLSRPLDAATVAEIRDALLDRGVVIFQNQRLDDAQMEAFIAHFGKPAVEPFVAAVKPDATPVSSNDQQPAKQATAVWHTDTTFVPKPPTLTALRAVSLPELGGDTCWASMYAAYDALSPAMRGMLDGLSAVHSTAVVMRRVKQTGRQSEETWDNDPVHPLVRVHPETGRKALFYNEACVSQIDGLPPAESAALLSMLREHVKSPEFAMRWRWQPDDLALWDNRCVLHFAVPDYSTPRIMQRVVTAGEVPMGPA